MDLVTVVVKAAAGDPDAFAALVRHYQQRTFGYAFMLLGDAHLAQDAVQQTFLAVHQSLGSLDRPDRFPAWLRAITRHECHRILRKRRVATIPLEATETAQAMTPPPDDLVVWRDALDHVLAAVEALSPRYREVVVPYYLEDASQREVAAQLGIPVSTVNMRLYTARQHLQTALATLWSSNAPVPPPTTVLTAAGRIVRDRGLIVDVHYPSGSRPAIFDAIQADDSRRLQVAQHRDPDIARCLAIPPHRRARHRPPPLDGSAAHLTIDADLLPSIIATLVDHDTPRSDEILETGISAIDLLCPLPRRGCVAIAGEPGAGKIVLVQELLARLANRRPALTFVVLIRSRDEVAFLRDLKDRDVSVFPSSDAIQVVYFPVSDVDGLSEHRPPGLDATIVLSRDLARRGIYPAVDPVRSWSRLLQTTLLGDAHVAVADAMRDRVAHAAAGRRTPPVDPRSDHLLRQVVSQPLFVAASWTGVPGRFRARADTVQMTQAILERVCAS